MPIPELPTWQDCHELWSKKRRRQLREQQDSAQNLPPGKPRDKHAQAIEEQPGGWVVTLYLVFNQNSYSLQQTIAQQNKK